MVRTRFAPSPTGFLHIGGLRTALYAFLFARKNGGKFILRIEDTDRERYVEGAVERILSSLKAAGLVYDEGPDVGGDYGPYVQSERKDSYLGYAKKLVERGGAYYCFCTKERLEHLHASGATKYDKHCAHLNADEVNRRIAAGEPYVIRQNIPSTGTTTYTDLVFGDIVIENKELEDGVLIKSDGMPTYNFANVVDDYLMGINYVLRGVEYLSSTPKYNHMYDGLGWERPKYIHLQPIMRDASHKLSKRYGDASYEDFLAKGFLSEAIINYIALLGWSPKDNREKFTLEEMIDLFSLDGISKSSSIFDEIKMRWLNSLYIKEMDIESFHSYAQPFYNEVAHLAGYDHRYVSELIAKRIETFKDVGEITKFLTEFDDFDLSLLTNEKWKTTPALALQMLPSLIALTDSLSCTDIQSCETLCNCDSKGSEDCKMSEGCEKRVNCEKSEGCEKRVDCKMSEGCEKRIDCEKNEGCEKRVDCEKSEGCEKVGEIDIESLNSKLEEYAVQNGFKKGQVLWVYRIALTGAKNTPGGAAEMAKLLGKERALARLTQTLKRCQQSI